MSDCIYVPSDCFAAQAGRFAALHVDAPTRGYVGNIDVKVDMVDLGGLRFPATINEAGGENAWVCSPLTTYSRYALEETRRVVPPAVARPLTAILGVADRWLRDAGLDQAVSVNNWLLSTNLYPSPDGIDFRAAADALTARWPGHAIWFRSLNFAQHAGWLHSLHAAGFELIPTRQVYLFPDVARSAAEHQNLRRDLKLLHATNLQQVDGSMFGDADFDACATLYGQLYLDKYSRLNPSYTAAFLRDWHRAGLLDLSGFRDASGRLCAVIGTFAQGPLITAPIVGYDTALPQSAGLYRLVMAHVLAYTQERSGTLNLSAGAAHFKRLRGGEPAIEYSAVLSDHLPARTRRALRLLRTLTTRLGVPVMQRFKL
ncbi:GNAT family N-acetyltransferase [Trinickia caryophylli]|uniref:Acetyltransferase (GNAT) domain-containing protein n=1 Tax=Trinickia caryophylli TaxID=28094 RepID=A0A1X7EH82_TRICW|nr:GNAT family N-acetyltransferase [Trinickia caryophylli]PMS11033.1 GNAT family N-acetyltransferase [Trinickia caryophylli]TRX14490.1 GNAT family N-acetyltransferase [Trinickia caryophylli]WQE14329.1 GNAT family N-acetyltransferase [Trinickia caryophylli]SMF33899.1 Acetyltransferase (GNAT) domain-containing protein [Trinickia caryophylli]GLU32288.1 hypothetical protein Busp01_21300 [Trinickia caryophylli]